MALQLHFQQNVASLKSKIIDPAKCVPQTSLYHQILKNSQATVDNQNRKFNLGNGQLFTDPIIAADQLLSREYADSALFDANRHEPVFIPPVFQSLQYAKKDSPVHILDFDVDIKTIKTSLNNLMKDSPNHWFTSELQGFYNLQQKNPDDVICAKEFSDWILNVKIMYLFVVEISHRPVGIFFRMLRYFTQQQNSINLTLPATTEDNGTFIQACIQELALKSPGTTLEQTLKKVRFICFGIIVGKAKCTKL